jgi:hypothetical protein
MVNMTYCMFSLESTDCITGIIYSFLVFFKNETSISLTLSVLYIMALLCKKRLTYYHVGSPRRHAWYMLSRTRTGHWCLKLWSSKINAWSHDVCFCRTKPSALSDSLPFFLHRGLDPWLKGCIARIISGSKRHQLETGILNSATLVSEGARPVFELAEDSGGEIRQRSSLIQSSLYL